MSLKVSMLNKKIRWRLILGSESTPDDVLLSEEKWVEMDRVLQELYEGDERLFQPTQWVKDIRKLFPTPMVRILQKDAMEMMGVEQMLLEPELLESMEMDPGLVTKLLALKEVMPLKVREAATEVVDRIVRDLEKKLRVAIVEAFRNHAKRSEWTRRPRWRDIHWNKTILKNLKNYQPDLRTIIPQTWIGYGKKSRGVKEIILVVDQSGSMGDSMVYCAIVGAVLSSIPSVKTNLIAFDSKVVDYSESLDDPVGLLFSVQMGGGTDINQAVAFSAQKMENPTQTTFILITDLYEGGDQMELISRMKALKRKGVKVLVLLALDDKGTPVYDKQLASQLVALDIPCFACTPDMLPEVLATGHYDNRESK
jgi:Mg-chelatase subunit ChlD